MKNSHKFLLAFALLQIGLIIASAFNTASHVTFRPPSNTEVVKGEGAFTIDTIEAKFQHLVSNFPVITYDVRYQDTIIVEAYESGRKHVSARVSNDTLYLTHRKIGRKIIDNQEVNSEFPIVVTIGVKNLKSIRLYDRGKLFINADPFGSTTDGDVVYKPQDMAQYQWYTDKLDIDFDEANKLHMFLYADEVNLTSKNSSSSINLLGKIKKFTCHNPIGALRTYSDLELDTAIITMDRTVRNYSSLNLNINDYLEAELHSDLDITYTGSPIIKKIETGKGRVVDLNNYRPDIKPKEDRLVIRDTTYRDSTGAIVIPEVEPGELIKQ